MAPTYRLAPRWPFRTLVLAKSLQLDYATKSKITNFFKLLNNRQLNWENTKHKTKRSKSFLFKSLKNCAAFCSLAAGIFKKVFNKENKAKFVLQAYSMSGQRTCRCVGHRSELRTNTGKFGQAAWCVPTCITQKRQPLTHEDLYARNPNINFNIKSNRMAFARCKDASP